MISFICPFCQQQISFADTDAGSKVRCPLCTGIVRVPAEIPSHTPATARGKRNSGIHLRSVGGRRPNILWVYWPILRLVLPAIGILCLVVLVGFTVYWKFGRDTWEADNGPQLAQDYSKAQDARSSGDIDKSIEIDTKIVETLSLRAAKQPLRAPELIDLEANASKDLQDARDLRDARNAREAQKIAAANPPQSPAPRPPATTSREIASATPTVPPSAAAAPAAPAPATNSAPVTAANIPPPVVAPPSYSANQRDEMATRDALQRALAGGDFKTPSSRSILRKKIAPLLAHIDAAADKEAAETGTRRSRSVRMMEDDSCPIAAALGDPDARDKIEALLASSDGETQTFGKCFQAHAALLLAGADDAAQAKALDMFSDILKSPGQDIAAQILTTIYPSPLIGDACRQKIEAMLTAGKGDAEKQAIDNALRASLATMKNAAAAPYLPATQLRPV